MKNFILFLGILALVYMFLHVFGVVSSLVPGFIIAGAGVVFSFIDNKIEKEKFLCQHKHKE